MPTASVSEIFFTNKPLIFYGNVLSVCAQKGLLSTSKTCCSHRVSFIPTQQSQAYTRKITHPPTPIYNFTFEVMLSRLWVKLEDFKYLLGMDDRNRSDKTGGIIFSWTVIRLCITFVSYIMCFPVRKTVF